jgi:hypothetical protein
MTPPFDLDAYNDWRREHPTRPLPRDIEEQIVAEVTRLRDAECLADARVAEMHDAAMLRERTAVVTWLRTLDDRWGLGASVCGAAADDIECGEHRKKEEP